jgi:hypothetical protein
MLQHLEHFVTKDLRLSAKHFGESERLCISRLLAIHRIQSYQLLKDNDSFNDFEKVSIIISFIQSIKIFFCKKKIEIDDNVWLHHSY